MVGVSFQYDLHTLKSGQTTAYPNYVAKWVGCPSGITWMFSTCGGGENAFLLACLCRRMQTSVRAEVFKALETLDENERQNLLALRRPLPDQDFSSPPTPTPRLPKWHYPDLRHPTPRPDESFRPQKAPVIETGARINKKAKRGGRASYLPSASNLGVRYSAQLSSEARWM